MGEDSHRSQYLTEEEAREFQNEEFDCTAGSKVAAAVFNFTVLVIINQLPPNLLLAAVLLIQLLKLLLKKNC